MRRLIACLLIAACLGACSTLRRSPGPPGPSEPPPTAPPPEPPP